MSCFIKKQWAAWLLSGSMLLSLCGTAFADGENSSEEPAPSPAPICSSWAEPELNRALELQLIPESWDCGADYRVPITRAQFTHLVVELTAVSQDTTPAALFEAYGIAPPAAEEASPEPTDKTPETLPPSFSDTQDPYVVLAAAMELVNGTGNGRFAPDDGLLRSQAAVMLHRAMVYLGLPDANAAPRTFSDGWTIPRWARDSVKYISGRTTETGQAVMGGSGTAFQPQAPYTIEQAVLTALRCYESRTAAGVYENWRNAPGYDTLSLTLSFGGDCTFGRSRGSAYAYSFDEMFDKKGPAYFFSGLEEFHTDDLTMVNFEGTLTGHTVPREEKPFIFKGPAKYAEILKQGSIDVVTVANNHSRDYGSVGFADTVKNLSPVVAVSGYDRLPILEVKGVKIGFASNVGWLFNDAQKQFIRNSIRSLRERGAEIIIFNYHWGAERVYHSNKTQQNIAHYCIDQGADLVIGHHPHVVQETETYKGKQIAYSLGNLCFGGNRNPSDKRCLIFQQSFTVHADTHKIVGEHHRAVPCSVSSTKNRNDYRPTRT